MKKEPKNSGFTLAELLITMAIAVILLTIAAPNFSNMVADNRLTSATNEFVSAIALARNVAITRKRNTYITALSPTNTNEWGAGGWVVWSDDDGDDTRDAGEDVRIYDAVNSVVNINSPGDSTDTNIVYEASGIRQPGGTTPLLISICDSRSDETGREITITLAGRPSLNRTYTGCNP